jgi:hypothetical protein
VLSNYYIEHLDELQPEDYNKFNKTPKKLVRTKEEKRLIPTYKLVRTLLKLNYLRPITMSECLKLSDIVKMEIKEDTPLTFSPYLCCRLNAPDPKAKPWEAPDDDLIYFADFEADVKGDYHRPYLICLMNASGTEKKSFVGSDCGLKFLDYLPDGALIYFHNLSYDFSFLAGYGVQSMIKKGNKNLSSRICFKNRIYNFRDSLSVIPAKLSHFPKMFRLNGIKKEKFPYKYYNFDLNYETIGKISEAGKLEDEPWKESDYKEFIENIDSLPGCRINENEFNMYLYAKFYCFQDVKILKEGFHKFREEIKQEYGMDVVKNITLSSVSDDLLKNLFIIQTGIFTSSEE